MSTACRTSHQLQYRIVHATSRLQSLSTDKIVVYPEALDGVPSDELEERDPTAHPEAQQDRWEVLCIHGRVLEFLLEFCYKY